MTDGQSEAGQRPREDARVVRAVRPKPARPLPTDRVGFDKQLLILRAYAKASIAADGQAVTNSEVAKYADIHPSSVSVCNPFWMDIGLIARDGPKNRPEEAVLQFDQAAEWNPDKAALKLARVIEGSWFGQALSRKLALRPSMLKGDALEFLADEAKAPKEYRLPLELLLDYARVAGIIATDGAAITRAPRQDDGSSSNGSPDTPKAGASAPSAAPPITQPPVVLHPAPDVERFSVPLPGKGSVLIELPRSMDADDWMMLAGMLAQYVRRWKKLPAPRELTDAISDEQQ